MMLPPSSVNLTAFPRIFTSTSRIRTASASTYGVSILVRLVLKLIFLFDRKPCIMFSTVSVTSLISIGKGVYLIFPLSIRLISSTSFIRVSKCSELLLIFSRQFFNSGVGFCLSPIFVNPIMAFIGVRISWDILLRNVLFALLADSAAIIASSAARRSLFNSSLFFCSILTSWLLRCTLIILIKASTIKTTMSIMMIITTRMVEFIIFIVLAATYSAGISSIRVMSDEDNVVRQ